MKKIKTFLITLCVCMLGAIAIVACGSTSKPGTYKLYAVRASMDGHTEEVKISDYPGLEADSVVIELNEDGTCSFKSLTSVTPATGTWKENEEDSNKIDMAIGGGTVTYVCKGGRIEIPAGEVSGVTTTYILKK